ncbi:hypothetical protein HerbRD11066_73400 [Herbidospora sp. RD11066]
MQAARIRPSRSEGDPLRVPALPEPDPRRDTYRHTRRDAYTDRRLAVSAYIADSGGLHTGSEGSGHRIV